MLNKSNRKIVLDTETTGLCPIKGMHRIVEIGCIELENFLPTGKEFHCYINPEREIDPSAIRVHGLSYEFLKNHPIFEQICDDFLSFISDSPLVIHNAKFDMKFIQHHLKDIGRDGITNEIIDTLTIARKSFPGSPASLDALCRRFNIDNTNREKHGAIIDSILLSKIYLELIGGKQPNLSMPAKNDVNKNGENMKKIMIKNNFLKRESKISDEEKELHKNKFKKIDNLIWRSFMRKH